MTPFHFENMKDYIGFDVKSCFSELKHFTAYIYSKIVHFDPKYLFVTERGGHETSLDSYLFKLAQQQGVHFEFSHPLSPSMFNSLSDNSIIAVGTYSGLSKQLNLRCTPFIHFDGHITTGCDNTFCLAYFDSYIGGYRYAYVAATKNIISGEIDFYYHQPYEHYLPRFKKQLMQTNNIEFTNWSLVKDYCPEKIHLLKKVHGTTVVLAGAISGFHDPFFGFGVNSALVSGKIAALTIVSKKKGIQEFNRFATRLARFFVLSKIYNSIPLRHLVVPRLFRTTTTNIPLVGKDLQSIPGFTHPDCFKVVRVE